MNKRPVFVFDEASFVDGAVLERRGVKVPLVRVVRGSDVVEVLVKPVKGGKRVFDEYSERFKHETGP